MLYKMRPNVKTIQNMGLHVSRGSTGERRRGEKDGKKGSMEEFLER